MNYKITPEIFSDKKNTSKEGAFHCNGCCFEIIDCKCDYILETFHMANW